MDRFCFISCSEPDSLVVPWFKPPIEMSIKTCLCSLVLGFCHSQNIFKQPQAVIAVLLIKSAKTAYDRLRSVDKTNTAQTLVASWTKHPRGYLKL
jgi:hypothetical protein